MGSNVKLGEFVGKCCDASVVNNNDMHLGRKLFENLFASEEYKRALKNGHYIGFLGHPEDPGCQDYEHACIVMRDCQLQDNDDITGSFDLIDTPVGRIVKAFRDAGVNFGISIRGAGDVAADGEVDPDTFVFRGFDLVTFPAYDDCIPEFREIAASSDVDKQRKFKKVCAAIDANLKDITSCTALEVIQEQLPENSSEFVAVGNRIAELESAECDECNLDEEKLKGVTQLYADALEKCEELKAEVDKLSQELAESNLAVKEAEVACSRKVASFKRIVTSQIFDLKEKNRSITASRNLLNKKISKLNKEKVEASNKLNAENLKYNKKIDENEAIISQQDSTIDELKSELRKTVAANKELSRRASNLDASVKDLKQRVEAADQQAQTAERKVAAAEQMILEYQQAYANMYANALGVHLDDVPVTASTSVKSLQDIINAGTSTSNIAVATEVAAPEGEEDFDLLDDEGIVTL